MSPLPPDPYKILGVSKDAQIAEIRSAHRKLVLKCHPDKVQDPEQKALKQDEFQKVQQAYEILSDEKERQKYDDTARLAELRKQMQNKANIAVSRSSPKYAEFEIRTPEPSSSYKSSSSHAPPPGVKIYTTTSYSRSWEDDRRSGPRYYDAEPARSSRREATYSDRPSKRETEKEREREKDRDKEKRKKREKEDELRREKEKEEKKREKERDKKLRDKQRSKEMKRDTGEKRRETSEAYIETYDDEAYVSSRSDKKKSSSSRKHEDKRERSAPRDRDEAASKTRYGSEETSSASAFARAYIQQSKTDRPERTHAYHVRAAQPPAAPTPPPADNAAFHPPEEEIRRSAARPRHGSGDIPNPLRERSSYNRPSRERLDRDDPIIVSASPTSRGQFPPKMSHPEMSSSPPHVPHVHRTNTMPVPSSASPAAAARPIPSVTRSNTFAEFGGGESPANRGRGRSRQYAQVPEETESEDDYERRAKEEYEERKYKDRKHRSSKKHRSPERGGETRYHVENGRTKMYHPSSSSYTRKLSEEPSSYYYEATPATSMRTEPRPSMSRDYSGSSYKVKTSKHISADDIQYSSYPQHSHYREDYGVAGYA